MIYRASYRTESGFEGTYLIEAKTKADAKQVFSAMKREPKLVVGRESATLLKVEEYEAQ